MQSIRTKQQSALSSYLRKHPKHIYIDEETIATITRRIERSIYNATRTKLDHLNMELYEDNPLFEEYYGLLCYRINVNLDSDSKIFSSHLLDGLINWGLNESGAIKKVIALKGKIAAYDHIYNHIKCDYDLNPLTIGFMCSKEINPTSNKKIEDELTIRMNQTIQLKTSQMYQCSNCKRRAVTYYTKQTRSFDEPATVFITCTFCGKQWKR